MHGEKNLYTLLLFRDWESLGIYCCVLWFLLINTAPSNIVPKYNSPVPQGAFLNLLNYHKIVFNFGTLDIVAMNILKNKCLPKSLIFDNNSLKVIVAIYTENSLSKKATSIYFPTSSVEGPCFPVPLPKLLVPSLKNFCLCLGYTW